VVYAYGASGRRGEIWIQDARISYRRQDPSFRRALRSGSLLEFNPSSNDGTGTGRLALDGSSTVISEFRGDLSVWIDGDDTWDARRLMGRFAASHEDERRMIELDVMAVRRVCADRHADVPRLVTDVLFGGRATYQIGEEPCIEQLDTRSGPAFAIDGHLQGIGVRCTEIPAGHD
jgi:hypothetical protein